MTKQVTLENMLAGGFGLPTGQIVPGNGSILVEPEIWNASKDHPVVAARVKAGTIIVDGHGKKRGGADERDENGDTPEMAQLRTQFDSVYASLKSEYDRAVGFLKTASDESDTRKARITELEAENAKLKKGDDDNAVTTLAEALALFSTDGVHANTAKAGAKKFLSDKVKADASKDDILKALLAEASDTELKTFLGAKGVEVKDETRDDLIKLALAA